MKSLWFPKPNRTEELFDIAAQLLPLKAGMCVTEDQGGRGGLSLKSNNSGCSQNRVIQ